MKRGFSPFFHSSMVINESGEDVLGKKVGIFIKNNEARD